MFLPVNNNVIFLFCDNVGTPIIEDLTLHIVPAISSEGKIQGNGRKFLDRFKSSFGSRISSQSLNEIHIYRLHPKSATRDDFFHIFLSLIVSLSRRMLPFLLSSNNVNTFLVPNLARQSYSRLNVLRLQFFRTFFVIFNCRSLFNEAPYLAALRRLRSPFAIRDANSKQSDKNLAVIGRCGPHLMIVMIFVT